MRSIDKIISILKEDWASAKIAIHRGEEIPFELLCEIPEGIVAVDKFEGLPSGVIELLKASNGPSLFIDDKYGQWGLNFYELEKIAPETEKFKKVRKENSDEYDLVIAGFIGDSDKVIVRNNPEASDYGTIIISNPIDVRADWCIPVADSLNSFLEKYLDEEGDKYWE
jgi:hypothetical protein